MITTPLTAFLWLCATQVAAPDLVEYVVKDGDTCSGIAKRMYDDKKRWDIIHEYNPWLGPTLPHHLEKGMVLKLPAKAVQLPDATVTERRRDVESRSPEQEGWANAPLGQELFRGWRVNTRESSSAEVTFLDDSRVELRENTLIIIYGGTKGRARRRSTEAKLDRGALRSRLGELSGKRTLQVTMPGASADLRGGMTLVSVADDGTSRLANHGEGKAALRSDAGGKVEVKPKTGSKVVKGKRPTKPKPLPASPQWKDDGPVFVTVAGRAGTIRGEWAPVAKAERYRVELFAGPEGGAVLTSQIVPKTVHAFEAQQLPAGDYWVTVAAIDDDAFESPPSPMARIGLRELGLVVPGGVRTGATSKDAADEGALVLPLGARLQSPPGLKCGVGAAEKTAVVGLDALGDQTIACVDAKGRTLTGPAVQVTGFAVTGPTAEGKALVAVRGESTELVFDVDNPAGAPARVWLDAPEGIYVSAPRLQSDGRWHAKVLPSAEATAPAQVRIVADAAGHDAELGVIDVQVDEPPASPVAPDEPRPEEPAPSRELHMIEGGVFGGLMFPPREHDLFQAGILDESQPLAAASPAFGVAVGYYPIRWVGAEVEASFGPTKLRTGERATLFGLRAHVVGQLPYRVTPILLVGGGTTGVASSVDVLGRDMDGGLHFGGGVKFFATRWLALRLDARDTVMRNPAGDFHHLPSLTLGLSGVLGRRSAKKQ